MARPYRLQAENTFYHITSRGDNKKSIYASEYDYKKFLEYVLKAKKRFKFYLYAYALMPNHYHLLIKTLQANLSKLMQYINGSYTTYYNVKRKKAGHLFQGRYKSIVVDVDNYFSVLTRYIHLNPVKKNIVKLPEEYKWSSYNAYIEQKSDGYIDIAEIAKILDMTKNEYQKFVMNGINENKDIFKHVYAGFLLGNKPFIKTKIEELTDRVKNPDITNKADLKNTIAVEDINHLIKKTYGKNFDELSQKRMHRMKEKKIAIYLLRELSGLNNTQIGKVFQMNSSAVSKAAIDIEQNIPTNKLLEKEIKALFSIFEV